MLPTRLLKFLKMYTDTFIKIFHLVIITRKILIYLRCSLPYNILYYYILTIIGVVWLIRGRLMELVLVYIFFIIVIIIILIQVKYYHMFCNRNTRRRIDKNTKSFIPFESPKIAVFMFVTNFVPTRLMGFRRKCFSSCNMISIHTRVRKLLLWLHTCTTREIIK